LKGKSVARPQNPECKLHQGLFSRSFIVRNYLFL
jgi:hypothetical protein